MKKLQQKWVAKVSAVNRMKTFDTYDQATNTVHDPTLSANYDYGSTTTILYQLITTY